MVLAERYVTNKNKTSQKSNFLPGGFRVDAAFMAGHFPSRVVLVLIHRTELIPPNHAHFLKSKCIVLVHIITQYIC